MDFTYTKERELDAIESVVSLKRRSIQRLRLLRDKMTSEIRDSAAESDSSSEMSDGALQNLVATLVKAGEEIEENEVAGDLGEESPEGGLSPVASSTAEHIADSNSVESARDEKLVLAATSNSVWPSFARDGPSPLPLHRKVSSRSPQSDGLDREAGLLASAEVSDVSSEGGQVEAPLAVTVASTGEDAEADSCGYEGDVGESTKLPPSLRRPADVVVVAPSGQVSSKDGGGGDEADDEGTGKSVNKSLLHHQSTSFALDAMARENLSKFGRSNSFCRLGGSSENIPNSPWEALNEALREQGFHEVPLSRHVGATVVPDLSSLASLFRDVLSQHGERGKIIEDMSFEVSKHQMTGYRDQAQNESFRRQKIDLSRRCTEAETRAMEVEEEKERLRERFAKESRRLKVENANLASQLKQSEHRVKAKEAAAQILMDKLRNEAEKERCSRQREREMLNFQQKGGGWAKNSEVNESFIANKRARERTEAEMEFLQAEVSRLNEELREKENTILQHHLGADWKPSHNDDNSDELQDLRDRLAESERIGRVMRQREARAFERCKEMEKQSRAIQTKLDETQESLVNAQMEISSRPSLRNWRASQRRVQDLETKLAKATSQAKEAMDVAELRRWVDTRELMRRDRGNHRLKLDRLDELPSTVMKQVLQDACRFLALQDVSLLAPSVAKLTKAVQMLPRLERFVNSVCAFVFRKSPEVLSESGSESLTQVLGGRTKTMEDVLPLLELWLARAQEPLNLKEFRQGVLAILETRTRQSQAKGKSDPQRKNDHAALADIQQLVELEQRSLEELELNKQAELSLNDDPELPVNRIVKHFQLLFGVKSIGGCIAKLNEVYRFSSGMQTFLRTAGDLLDMPDASHQAIIRQLTTVLETRHDVNPDARLRFSHDAISWSETPSVDETEGVQPNAWGGK